MTNTATAENMSNITVVPEDLKNHSKAGALVHWRLSGFIEQDKFKEALQSILSENLFPSESRAEKYLREAMETLKFGAADIIRKLPNGKGFSLVREDNQAIDLEKVDAQKLSDAYKVTLTGKITKNPDDTETVNITPKDHPQAEELKNAYNRYRSLYSCSVDISQWLSVRIMPMVNALPYRDRGGIYIIPPGADLTRFCEIANALHSISKFDTRGKLVEGCKVYTLPVMSDEHLQEAALDSLMEDVDDLSNEVAEKMKDNDLSLRGWQGVRGKVNKTFDKFKKFEEFLGISLESLTAQLGQMEVNIGMMEIDLQVKKQEEEEEKRKIKVTRVK